MDQVVLHLNKILLLVLPLVLVAILSSQHQSAEAVWCVARSGASDDVLQSALDYACAAGADCGPISEKGLCFLPNTIQAHASYAFNSLYQRNHMSASGCDFGKSATIAQTDPSYGSCVYPASPRAAGSLTPTTGGTSMTNPYGTVSPLTPTTTAPPTIGGTPGMGMNPTSMGPPIPMTNDSTAPPKSSTLAMTLVLEMFLLLLLLVALF